MKAFFIMKSLKALRLAFSPWTPNFTQPLSIHHLKLKTTPTPRHCLNILPKTNRIEYNSHCKHDDIVINFQVCSNSNSFTLWEMCQFWAYDQNALQTLGKKIVAQSPGKKQFFSYVSSSSSSRQSWHFFPSGPFLTWLLAIPFCVQRALHDAMLNTLRKYNTTKRTLSFLC